MLWEEEPTVMLQYTTRENLPEDMGRLLGNTHVRDSVNQPLLLVCNCMKKTEGQAGQRFPAPSRHSQAVKARTLACRVYTMLIDLRTYPIDWRLRYMGKLPIIRFKLCEQICHLPGCLSEKRIPSLKVLFGI